MEEINKDELKQKLDSDSDIALIEVLDHKEYVFLYLKISGYEWHFQ